MIETEQKQLAMGWIIFWLILFWPVGLVLLIKRQKTDKSAKIKSYKGILITSYVLMGLGIIYLFMGLTGAGDALLACLVYGGGGVFIFLYARKAQQRSENYRKYINIIINQNQTSIDSISSAVGHQYDSVVNDLQNLVNDGYLPGAYIDVSQRKVILGEMTKQWGSQLVAPKNPVNVQSTVVTCSGCSANNQVIVGQANVCEYCGTFLQ